MKHYLVSWTNHMGAYRSHIVYAKDGAQARQLVNASYCHASKIKSRALLPEKRQGTNLRAPQKVITNLEEVLRVTKMEHASFSMSHEKMTITSGFDVTGEEIVIDDFIKERTRIYRESWLIPQIEEALAWARGES